LTFFGQKRVAQRKKLVYNLVKLNST